MTATVLFVGGPADGRIEVVERALPSYVLPCFSHAEVRWTADGPDLTGLPVTSIRYDRRRIDLFGRRVDVWVHSELHGDVADLAAARHLLSPTANRLIAERNR